MILALRPVGQHLRAQPLMYSGIWRSLEYFLRRFFGYGWLRSSHCCRSKDDLLGLLLVVMKSLLPREERHLEEVLLLPELEMALMQGPERTDP